MLTVTSNLAISVVPGQGKESGNHAHKERIAVEYYFELFGIIFAQKAVVLPLSQSNYSSIFFTISLMCN